MFDKPGFTETEILGFFCSFSFLVSSIFYYIFLILK